LEDLSPSFHFCITYNRTNNTPNLTELISAFQRQQMHLISHSNPNFSEDGICSCTYRASGCPTVLRPSGHCSTAHISLTCSAQLVYPTALYKKYPKQTKKNKPQSRQTSYTHRNNVSDDGDTIQTLY